MVIVLKSSDGVTEVTDFSYFPPMCARGCVRVCEEIGIFPSLRHFRHFRHFGVGDRQ